jgi:hypothetical protein
MATFAAIPWWVVMMIIFAVIGPMSRMGRARRSWSRRTLPDEEVRRLEAALGERDQVIDDLQRRLGEMEERMDFTERLLASRKEELLSPRQG